jgi:transposase
MESIPVYVGLDYHELAIEVHVMDARGRQVAHRRCPNQVEAVVAVVPPQRHVAGAALEACCGGANFAEELLRKTAWNVALAHPGFVARMKQNPDKHDFGDARMLADLERVGYLPQVWLAPESIRQLRRLVRYRQQLVAERRDTKLRMRAVLREERAPVPPARPWTQSWMSWLASVTVGQESRWVLDRYRHRLEELAREIRVVEQRLAAATQDDPVVQKLLTFFGVGLVTAVTLRAEIGRFDRFRTGKQLARFAGVTPRNASSGQRQADAGLIKAGNPQLRAMLIETAHRLMRLDPHWAALGGAIRCRRGSGSVAAAAVANRWLRWLFHQMCPLEQAA